MEEKKVIEQLNKEIEKVDLPVTPLNNVLREMRLIKDKREKDKQKGRLSARMKRFIVAACSIAFIAVITPIIYSQSSFLGQQPKIGEDNTNSPSGVASSYSGNLKTFSTVEEVYVEIGASAPLPKADKFEGEQCVYMVYYDESTPFKVEATYGNKLKLTVMLVRLDYENNAGDEKIDIGLTEDAVGYANASEGMLYFTYEEYEMMLGYYGVNSFDNVLQLVQTIK